MKINLRAVCLALGLVWLAAPAPALNLKVDIVSDTHSTTRGGASRGRSASTPQRTTTQTRSLQVTLTNPTRENLADLTVVYYLFARDVQTKQIVLVKKGEKIVTVKPLGKEIVNTDDAVLTSQSSHSRTVGGRVETTPASGQKYFGYGVQVLAGANLLAQMFDPPELKASINLPETPPTPGATRPARKAAKN